jgi:putative endopeptidase
LIGDDVQSASKHAQTVLAVESRLSNGQFTNVELRNPEKNYNKIGLADLDLSMPNMAWKGLFTDLHIRTDTVVLGQLPFFNLLDKLLKDIPLEDWRTYLKATTISNSANSLTNALADANFEFYGKTLAGQKKRKPRWQHAVTTVDGQIGDLVGQLYVREYFDERARQKMMEIINTLQLSYKNRIVNLDWMSGATKKEALGKLNTIIRKVGYPDKWKTYDSLAISRNDYFKNRINTNRYEFFRNIAKNGKPVDRHEWAFTPPTVNAFYGATTNEIMFLAGILQPPFFFPNGDDAINYGAIGMVIGHELTHGFDDEGRNYDKNGNLRDWWQKEDAQKFDEKARLVAKQYRAYVPIDSLHINPDLTMGENLADIGGLAIAYDAFKMTPQGKKSEKIDGLTPEQRFFIAFAGIWQMKIKEELMRRLVLTDPHSPARFRVNGPLSNFTPFYKAFGLTDNNAMWKPTGKRIQVW